MKTLLLTTVLWSAFAGGDRERGLQLYKEGKYRAAQEAFQAALAEDPDSAELQWNLALAAWRAGDLDTAEVAAEKYAALAKKAKDELHRGMLGVVRFEQALQLEKEADAAIAMQQSMAAAPDPDQAPGQATDQDPDEIPQPLPLLEKALQKALNARNHFVRGARANPTPEILRNTERALRKIDELKKRIEEMMQQQQQEQGDQNEDEQKPEEDGKDEEKNSSDEKEGDKKEDDKKEGEQKQEENKSDEKSEENKEQQEQKSEGEEKSDEKNSEKSDEKSESESKPGEGEDPPDAPEPQQGNKDEKSDEKPGEQKPGEQQKEPDGKEQAGNEQQQKGDDQKPPAPEPKPGESRSDAPGEGGQGLELTPEQAQRLLDRAKKLDEQLKKAKKRQTSRRRAVERDW